MGVDPLVQGGIGRVAPVALGDQHLEQLAPARHQGAQVAGGLVRQGSRGRPHRLGEASDRFRVEAVGLRQPAGGAREGANLAGKPAKLALTAWMRKLVVTLNAMLRTDTTWKSA